MAVLYLSEDERCNSVSPCFLPTTVPNDTLESGGFLFAVYRCRKF